MEFLKNITEDLNLLPLNGPVVLAKIVTALLCGLFISWVYRRNYRGPGYSVGFTNSLILLAMTTAIVIMVIGNNLARAFGLVGAMSLVRFRHAVKNTQDTVYVFLALACGMAAGVGFYTTALIGTVMVGAVMFILARTRFNQPRRDDFLLQFNYRSPGGMAPPYASVFEQHCRKATPVNARTLGDTDLMELSFYVRLRDPERSQELVRDLNRTPGIQYVNLFFDEEQI